MNRGKVNKEERCINATSSGLPSNELAHNFAVRIKRL